MLLEAKNLKQYFPAKGNRKNYVKAVDGVSFQIAKGTTYGLVGESGCGKSTIARTITKLYDMTEGDITFHGKSIRNLKGKELKNVRKNIQMVFQDPYASLNPRMTVGKILMESLLIHQIGNNKKEQMERVRELLEIVGLDIRYVNRYPHEFSGGQRQRIGIARAIALNPELVILDEAISALDVSIQSQIINLLQKLQKQFNLTYLFISHDLSVVEYMCDKIGVMYLGHFMEEGSRKNIFEECRHPYTRALLSVIPDINPENRREPVILEGELPSPSDPPKGCVFCTRCPQAQKLCFEERPELRTIREEHKIACHFNTEGII